MRNGMFESNSGIQYQGDLNAHLLINTFQNILERFTPEIKTI